MESIEGAAYQVIKVLCREQKAAQVVIQKKRKRAKQLGHIMPAIRRGVLRNLLAIKSKHTPPP